MSKRTNLFLLVLALLLLCRLAYGGPVGSLFNPNNFIAEDGAFISERFWSTPTNKLYSKSVADWDEEDFSELNAELRRAIYSLSLSNSPYRNIHVDRLQRAVDLVPSFKLWAKNGKEGKLMVDEAVPVVVNAKSKPEGTSSPQSKSRLLMKMESILPTWMVQSEYWKKLLLYTGKYILPYLLPVFLISLLSAAGWGGWHFVQKRITVPYCPKCKTKDKTKLKVGTRSFRSIFRKGKRKCYCSACGYKWIQR